MSKRLITQLLLAIFISPLFFHKSELLAAEETQKQVHRGIKGAMVVAAVGTMAWMAFAKQDLAAAQGMVSALDRGQWNLSRYGSGSPQYQKMLDEIRGQLLVSNYKNTVFSTPISGLTAAITQRVNAALAYQILAGIVGGGALIRLPFPSAIDPLPFYVFTCIFTIMYGSILGKDIENAITVPVQGLFDSFQSLVLTGYSQNTANLLLAQLTEFLQHTRQATLFSYATIPMPEAGAVVVSLLAFSVWIGSYLIDFLGDGFDAMVTCIRDSCHRQSSIDERREGFRNGGTRLSQRIGERVVLMGSRLNVYGDNFLQLNNQLAHMWREGVNHVLQIPLARQADNQEGDVPNAVEMTEIDIERGNVSANTAPSFSKKDEEDSDFPDDLDQS